ncbi:MAG TPA: hypothetical protein VFH22_03445 [Rhodocyclaceae bacterium]|nr:hypothetical protein [Rhodocyclaceae bacterium]
MNERTFAKRLQHEIPAWQAEAWASDARGTAGLPALLSDARQRFREALF